MLRFLFFLLFLCCSDGSSFSIYDIFSLKPLFFNTFSYTCTVLSNNFTDFCPVITAHWDIKLLLTLLLAVFDIESFYPSITSELFHKAIDLLQKNVKLQKMTRILLCSQEKRYCFAKMNLGPKRGSKCPNGLL